MFFLFSVCVVLLIAFGDFSSRVVFLFHTRMGKLYAQWYSHYLAKTIIHLLTLLLDFRLQVDTPIPPVPERFIIISNHQSLIDSLIIFSLFPRAMTFVMKRELEKFIPFFSFAGRMVGCCYIDRKNLSIKRTIADLTAFAQSSKKTSSLIGIYPQGGRSKTNTLGMLYPFGLKVLLQTTPLPIVVLSIHGLEHMGRLDEIMTNSAHQTAHMKILGIIPAPEHPAEINSTIQSAFNLLRNDFKDS